MLLYGAIFSCLTPIAIIAASLSFKDPFVIPLDKQQVRCGGVVPSQNTADVLPRMQVADRIRRSLSPGAKSDHVTLLQAYQLWEQACDDGNERSFCWDHFLSGSTLRMIANMKQQFVELLQDIGFVEASKAGVQACDSHASNINLIKAVLAAGLYPNVVMVEHPHGALALRPAEVKGFGLIGRCREELWRSPAQAAHP
jgi:ATP-dependent RNA helicase DHX36